MIVPIDQLTQDQRIWYTKLVINCVLSDANVRLAEVDFIRDVIGTIENPESRKVLMKALENETKFELDAVPRLPKQQLALIFIQLIHLVIADKDFSDGENKFLRDLAEQFDFTDGYYKELMRYCAEGLAWRQAQDELLFDEDEEVQELDLDAPLVPIFQLHEEIKQWYARVITHAFMIDEELMELNGLDKVRLAVSGMGDRQEKLLLFSHLKHKQKPPLKRPPVIPEKIMRRIFMDLMLFLTRQGSLSYQGQQYLKKLSDISKLNTVMFTKLMDWCNLGMVWRQAQKDVVDKARTNMGDELVVRQGVLEQHDGNNSIMLRRLHCFVCSNDKLANEDSPVTAFILKPRTQKTDSNIFGIPKYLGAHEGCDPVDYNLVAPIVCPRCLFTHINKDYFKKADEKHHPDIHRGFTDKWMQGLEERKKLFRDPSELQSINRSPESVIKLYDLITQVSDELSHGKPDHALKGTSIGMMLTKAELLTNLGKTQDADALLLAISQKAQAIFDNCHNNIIVFRLARLMLLISLYFEDKITSGRYLDFFLRFKDNQAHSLSPGDRMEFQRCFGEVKNGFDNREQFAKPQLDGLHLKRFKKKTAEDIDNETKEIIKDDGETAAGATL